MLTDQHAQSPTDDPPPLGRRDHRIPAAGQEAPDTRLRDMWLAEMWSPVREYRQFREDEKPPKKAKRKRSTAIPPDSPGISTGCAEIGSTEVPGSAA